jgi:hypothetical protein
MADNPISSSKYKKVALVDDETITTPKGNVVTTAEWKKAASNGLPFKSLQDYANYLDGWAKPVAPIQPVQSYVRGATGPNINGTDIEALKAQNDPSVNAILNRNIAPQGQVPQYGADDTDAIKAMIAANAVLSPAKSKAVAVKVIKK